MREKIEIQAKRLCGKLKPLLETMPEHSPFPSTRRIQEEYSVNRRVVFAALRRLEEENLIRIVPRGGVYSTGILCRSRGALIHLCLPEYPSRWLSAFIREIEDFSSRRRQVHFRKRMYHYETDSIIPVLETDCDAAAILVSGRNMTREELRGLLDYPHPLLFISKHLEDLPLSSVAMNDHMCGVLAAEYLLSKGHRRFGVLICEPYLYGIAMIADTFVHTVENAGGACVVIDSRMESGEFSPQMAFDTLLPHLDQPELEFTALFVINDTAAPGVLRACRETNWSIPEDLSLLCSGELPDDAEFQTPLSTVGISGTQMASAVSETLLDMIENPNQTFHVNLMPELHERASVQPPAPSRT